MAPRWPPSRGRRLGANSTGSQQCRARRRHQPSGWKPAGCPSRIRASPCPGRHRSAQAYRPPAPPLRAEIRERAHRNQSNQVHDGQVRFANRPRSGDGRQTPAPPFRSTRLPPQQRDSHRCPWRQPRVPSAAPGLFVPQGRLSAHLVLRRRLASRRRQDRSGPPPPRPRRRAYAGHRHHLGALSGDRTHQEAHRRC